MPYSVDTPLDLYELFIQQITGTETIFIFAALFLIASFAAKMKFPNIVTIMLFFVFGLIFGVVFRSLLIITLLIMSFIIFVVYNRMINK